MIWQNGLVVDDFGSLEHTPECAICPLLLHEHSRVKMIGPYPLISFGLSAFLEYSSSIHVHFASLGRFFFVIIWGMHVSIRALQLPSAKHIPSFLILRPVATTIVQIADFEHQVDALKDNKRV